MILVGQSLTWHSGRLAEAVRRRQAAPVIARAIRQVEAGADALDLNAGIEGNARDLVWVARTLRKAGLGLPLWLDAGDPHVLLDVAKRISGPVVLNALPVGYDERTWEAAYLEAVADLEIGLVISPRIVPVRGYERALPAYLEGAEYAVERASYAGIGECYLDALAYPVTTHPANTEAALTMLAAYRDEDLSAIPLFAVGNVTHGAPPGNAPAIRAAYTRRAVEAGAGALILPVEDEGLVAIARGRAP